MECLSQNKKKKRKKTNCVLELDTLVFGATTDSFPHEMPFQPK